MAWLGSISLLSGWLPVLLTVVGFLALAFLLFRPSKRHLLWSLIALVAAAALAAALSWATVHVWYLWPEDLPGSVITWFGVGLAGLLLGIVAFLTARRRTRTRALKRRRPKTTSRPRRILRAAAIPVATVLVVVMAALQINIYFGSIPTLKDLGGTGIAQGLPDDLQADGQTSFVRASLADTWTPPEHLPATGTVRHVSIPGTVSGFAARDAVLYLPPAYEVADRPALPVLVLVAGQPGGPDDWVRAGHLVDLMDAWAKQHEGLAPVVVVADPNGSDAGNTMCMDSKIAKADTYMAVDVPKWLETNLTVDMNHSHWAVGGFSFGGTCAMQMITRHPDVYSSFIVFASEREPALTADRNKTIQEAFGGDEQAFTSQVPLTLMAKNSYPGLVGWIGAGADDPDFIANANALNDAAQKSGMTTKVVTLPGGHSWNGASPGLTMGLDFIGPSLGLVKEAGS